VTVVRDEWGIPHVRAATASDAFFGQGFVHAEDRLGQLEYDRRRAYGRWAEVAGASAVAFDCFARRCGLRDAARREYEALPESAREVLDSYARGVNAYLALDRPLPTDLSLAGVVPEAWEPFDSNAVFLVRHVVFANWQKKMWRARVATVFGPDAAAALERDDRPVPVIVPPGAWAEPYSLEPADLTPVLDAMAALGPTPTTDELGATAAPDDPGSNAWALAGTRTATGKPLVAGDPHRTIEVPGVYVQNHLACPDFDAVGLAFAGVPGLPHFGHNARVAWCVTNAYGDYQDLYVERFVHGETLSVETAAGRGDVEHRVESVQVRDAPAVMLDCYETSHGPVVFGDPATGAAIAMRSTALVESSAGLGVLAPMLRAHDVDELCEVMRAWVDPVNNLVCADVDGNIAYHTVGVIPRRSRANAWGPVPGWTGAHEWEAPIPYDELPRLRNPEGGALVTANQRIVGPAYPYHLSDGYSRPDRAERIVARLAELETATNADMAAIHRDVRSLRADVWVEALTALAPDDPVEQTALALLEEWDQELRVESAGASVVMVVRDAVCRRLAHHPLFAALRSPFDGEPAGAFVGPATRLWPACSALLARKDPLVLPPGESWTDVLAQGLADGVAILRLAVGDDAARWRWGALHQNAPQHPLAVKHPEWADRLDPSAVEMAGEWDTVFSTAHAAGSSFAVTGGSVARYVFDLADWDASGWIVPLGAHGDAADPHFVDQRAAWVRGELIPMRYDWREIEANGSAVTVLTQPTT
jgi:penicillin amidase